MTNITKVDKRFYNEIKGILKESDIQGTYRTAFTDLPGSEIKSYSSTDGVLIAPYPKDYEYHKDTIQDEHRKLVALLEFKHNRNFQNSEDDVISVLMQSLYYLKKLEKENTFPKVIFGADQNAGFCISTDKLQKYLHDENIDWSFAPSSAYTNNPKLANKLKNDINIDYYYFTIDENFKFSDIILKMFNLDEGNIIKVPITDNNIDAVFKEFNKNILKEKNITPQQKEAVFTNMLIDPDHNYLEEGKSIFHTTVKGINEYGTIKVDVKRYKSFFNHYKGDYTLKEKDNLVKTCDRLKTDNNRRREGAFFTPTIWVNEAHRQIEAQLGENWKNEYVVWDCCCGTGNLTRDYQFANLYSSTLLQEEIDILKSNDVNGRKNQFKHDFTDKSKESLELLRAETSGQKSINSHMNNEDEIPSYLLKGLQTALEENKPIVFFMNPPYGAAGHIKNNTSNMEGTGSSSIKELMKENNMGRSSDQLFTQFLYRILMYKQQYNLTNVVIATFGPPVFLTGSSAKTFRKEFLNNFNYKSGMIFKSTAFADINAEWQLSFTIWENGIAENKKEFNVELRELNEETGTCSNGVKTLYNMDNDTTANPWAKEEVKGTKANKQVIQVASALNPNLNNAKYGNIIENSLGFFQVGRNSVRGNAAATAIYSTLCTWPHGISILPSNYKKCVSMFIAKKTIHENWINENDEYYAPNTTHLNYEQWNNDAIVYSLFNTSSQQSSLRNIQHEGKSWDVKNEFFWLSRQHMLSLGETHYYDDLQRDVANDTERFIYTQLQNTQFSPDAQQVLDKATELVEKSFQYRKEFNNTPTKLGTDKNLQCWDAGWYQIKLILKEYLPEDLKAFNKLYANFETRMREGVYEFGFLRR